MRHFKVYQDFNRYVPIDETEYEKALYAFFKGKPAIFEMGAVSRIESITPDINKNLGWYSDYKPTQDDNVEIEKAREEIKPYILGVKNRVQYLIETKQEHLIGKNVEIPELQNRVANDVKSLANKFKV